jgi:hypothetical protein
MQACRKLTFPVTAGKLGVVQFQAAGGIAGLGLRFSPFGYVHISSDDVTGDFMDFKAARQKRREILAILGKQQADDAECLNEIKKAAIDGKRRLLKALGTWLLAIRGDDQISVRTRSAFAALTNQVSPDDWGTLKRNHAALESRLRIVSSEARSAEDAYNKAAPYRFLSSIAAGPEQKELLALLKDKRDRARLAREATERDLVASQQALSKACELCLRDAQTPEHLQKICEDQDLAPLARPVLEETKQRSTELWEVHAQKHSNSTAEMAAALADLKTFYARAARTAAEDFGKGTN